MHEQSDDEDPQDQSGGYLIVALPDSFEDVGNVIYSFSLNGSSSIRTTSAKKVFPDTVFSHQGVVLGGHSHKGVVELRPGETKVLEDDTTYFLRDSDATRDEAEMVRIVIKVTGLVDGQLPKRDDPSTNR